MNRYLLLVVFSGLWIVADQLTKIWSLDALLVGPLPDAGPHIRMPTSGYDVLSWLRFELAGNPGAAWGLFRWLDEAWRVPFFLVINAVAFVVIVGIYRRTRADQGILRMALAFILGGAIGNVIDRLRFGYVIDFIKCYTGDPDRPNWQWPTFNVADIAISVGVGLLVLDMLKERKSAKREELRPEA